MLFTFPSRYWFAIGHRVVLSLGRWSSLIQTGFHVSRPTRGRARRSRTFAYGAFTLSGPTFQTVPLVLKLPLSHARTPQDRGPTVWAGPRSLAATRGVACCFPFLQVLRCFSSPRLPLFRGDGRLSPPGCPIRKSPDQCLFSGSPKLIAAIPRPSSPPGTKASTESPY